MNRRTRLVYILAASHSGSTLLAMLLGSHPDICTVGELKFTALGDVNRYRCSCRKEIKKCSFWNGISEDMARRGIFFDVTNAGTDLQAGANWYENILLQPLHRSPFVESIRELALELSSSWKLRIKKIQLLNSVLPECILQRTGKNVIVDSSKIGLRLKYLLRNANIDVKVIHLIRDGRGVAMTYTDPAKFADARDPSLWGGGTGEGRDGERLAMNVAAREWRRSNEEAVDILKGLDRKRWMEIRYEDICLHTEKTMNAAFEFIGVPQLPVLPNFRAVDHHVLGNGMRFDTTEEVWFDERWRTSLSSRDLEVFDAVAGEMNRHLGYT